MTIPIATDDPSLSLVHVLLVEDNPDDARLIRRILGGARDPAFEVNWVRDLPEALDRLSRGEVDAVLTDLNLPSSVGLDTLQALRSRAPRLPVVVLTGSYLEASLGRQAVHQGAQDYLDKQNLGADLLPRAIAFAVERKRRERLQEESVQNICHELRAPLTVAYGHLRCLSDGEAGPLKDRQREFIETTLRNISHLNLLVEEVQDASRAEQGKFSLSLRRVDLGALVAGMAAEFRVAAEERGLALTVRFPAGLPPALADPKACRQILMNLIANAVKFTPRGGRVVLEAEPSASEPGFLRVCVADSGPGVPSAERERVFERLYQSSSWTPYRKGLGLGLFICREIARRQGGRIWVESEAGRGSRFYFTVPLLPAALSSAIGSKLSRLV